MVLIISSLLINFLYLFQIPTMIVYGTKDTTLGPTSTNDLRNLANNEIFPMEGAKHPCYLDDPDYWHKILYNFLKSVEREEGVGIKTA